MILYHIDNGLPELSTFVFNVRQDGSAGDRPPFNDSGLSFSLSDIVTNFQLLSKKLLIFLLVLSKYVIFSSSVDLLLLVELTGFSKSNKNFHSNPKISKKIFTRFAKRLKNKNFPFTQIYSVWFSKFPSFQISTASSASSVETLSPVKAVSSSKRLYL